MTASVQERVEAIRNRISNSRATAYGRFDSIPSRSPLNEILSRLQVTAHSVHYSPQNDTQPA